MRATCPVSFRRRLRHQAGLQSNVTIAHFAFKFRLRNQRSDRVDHDQVNGVRRDDCGRDFERLLSGIGLRDEKIIDVYTQRGSVFRVRGVFRIDKRRVAAGFLRFGDDMQRECRLAGGLRPIDLNYASPRQTADSERVVYCE